MLIDFTVENFRSIKEPVTLSAVAQRTRTRKEPRIIPDDEITPPHHVDGWDFDLLPALGIFGANASGKSNVLVALSSYLHLTTPGFGLSPTVGWLQPFLLGESPSDSPTSFQARYALGGATYVHEVKANRAGIIHESLTYSPANTKRERLLYTRDHVGGTSKHAWTIGYHFGGPHVQFTEELDAQITYLAVLYQLDLLLINPIKLWLMYRDPRVVQGEWYEEASAVAGCQSPELLRRVSSILRQFDTGVSELRYVESRPGSGAGTHLEAVHRNNGSERVFSFNMESSGTRSLFVLACQIIRALDYGTLLIIDELGAHTHPHITHELVRMFQNPRTNPKRAQLIFASHDNTLMRDHLLRRDQIWFAEKGLNGVTKLFPLSDFKARNDTSIEWSYFYGRYGAVPVTASAEEIETAVAAAC